MKISVKRIASGIKRPSSRSRRLKSPVRPSSSSVHCPSSVVQQLGKYERMLKGMQKKQKKTGRKNAEKWFLYMLRCADQSLYTGVAKNIEQRFKAHSSGKGARYTRARLPLEIVYRETCKSRTDALVREFKIKKLSPKRKRTLVEAYRVGGKALKKAVRESACPKRKKRKTRVKK